MNLIDRDKLLDSFQYHCGEKDCDSCKTMSKEHCEIYHTVMEQEVIIQCFTGKISTVCFNDGIDILGLSVRTYSCLIRSGIRTIGDLCSKTKDEMCRIRNLGRKMLEEIIDAMKQRNLSFRGE